MKIVDGECGYDASIIVVGEANTRIGSLESDGTVSWLGNKREQVLPSEPINSGEERGPTMVEERD